MLGKKIGFMAYGTLGFGLLSGAFTSDTTFGEADWRSEGVAFGLPLFQPEEFAKELKVVERLKKITVRHDKSIAQMAIAWTLGHASVSVALVGMRNQWELKENVAAVELELTDEIREEIDTMFSIESVSTHVDAEQAI